MIAISPKFLIAISFVNLVCPLMDELGFLFA